MPQSQEHIPEEQFIDFGEGTSEAISSPEEGNGPACPGCNKPTKIKNGRFFCTNKARASDNSFQCPFQTADSEIEVTQYISEETKQKALEAEKNDFPNDESDIKPEETRDFSFPDEQAETTQTAQEFSPNAGFSETLESIEEVTDEDLQTYDKLGAQKPSNAELTEEEQMALSRLEEINGNNALTQEISTSDIARAAEALKSIGIPGFEEIVLAGGNEEQTMELLHKLPPESRNTLLWRAGQINAS